MHGMEPAHELCFVDNKAGGVEPLILEIELQNLAFALLSLVLLWASISSLCC